VNAALPASFARLLRCQREKRGGGKADTRGSSEDQEGFISDKTRIMSFANVEWREGKKRVKKEEGWK